MKLNIQKGILENALVRSHSFVSKDISDISSQIALIVKDNILLIQATDYEMGIILSVDNLMVIDDGIAFVSGAKLLSTVKALKNGDVNIEVKGDILSISQSKSKFKLPLFESVDFPKFPDYSGFDTLSLNSVAMIDSFAKVITTIDSNNPKFELTGSVIKIGLDSVEFASTDTKRLSVATLQSGSTKELNLIIPKKAIIEMQKLFFDDVEMFYSDSILVIKTDNTQFYTRLINGKFPEYTRIIPKESNHSFTLQKIQTIESIKQIATFSNEIKITFKSNTIEIESLTGDNNEAKTEIEFDAELENSIELNVNSTYVMDFLNSIVEPDFTIEITEEGMPFILKSDNLKTVIMPIVV